MTPHTQQPRGGGGTLSPPNSWHHQLIQDYISLYHNFLKPKLLELPILQQIETYISSWPGTEMIVESSLWRHLYTWLRQYLYGSFLMAFAYWFFSTRGWSSLIPRKIYSRIQEDISLVQVGHEPDAKGWMPLAQRYIDARGLPTGVGYIEQERRQMNRWAHQSPNMHVISKYSADKKMFRELKGKKRRRRRN